MKRATLFAALALAAAAASAQQYPSRAVTLNVGFAPGGGTDTVARVVQKPLGDRLGQQVVVDNKPGAGGNIATNLVAKGAPDGHTIFMTTDATFSINPHLYKKLPYDPERDFMPVTMLVLLQQMMVAHPSVPANTLAELIDYAKKNPGKLNYASYGSGSQPHLSGEMLKHKAGIDLVHVPYKGISLAVPAVIAGEVQLTFSGIASGMGPLKAGRIKALAIGGKARSPLLPQIPTFAELGYPEVETHAWFGWFLPAGSPQEAVTRIYKDVKAILEDPEFRQKQLIDRGYEVVGSSPAEFASYMKTDREKRGVAVKISGAKAE